MSVELDPGRVLVLSIVVLWTRERITQKAGALRRFSVPIAVTGGVLCSGVVALLDVLTDVRVSFDLEIRDTLLLVFFSTIGLSSKLGTLREGGLEGAAGPRVSVASAQMIRSNFFLAICMRIGDELNTLLRERGTVLPRLSGRHQRPRFVRIAP